MRGSVVVKREEEERLGNGEKGKRGKAKRRKKKRRGEPRWHEKGRNGIVAVLCKSADIQGKVLAKGYE